jgi:hypothetical protein
MTIDDQVTVELLTTAAGAVIAAGIITTLVELIKNIGALAWWNARLDGASQAFLFSLVFYLLIAVGTHPDTANEYLGLALAWLSCATSAIGIHRSVISRITDR